MILPISLLSSLLTCTSSLNLQHDLELGLQAVADAGRSFLAMTRSNNLQSLSAFHYFMRAHNKTYSGQAEYKRRYSIFRSNMRLVERLQAEEKGSAVYGATELADLTTEEFRTEYLGYSRARDDPDIHWPTADIPDIPLPESHDWRDLGAVSPVKNQVLSVPSIRTSQPSSGNVRLLLGLQHGGECGGAEQGRQRRAGQSFRAGAGGLRR